METGINSYLHKKFKKQLSIDARQIKNDVNNEEKKINTIIATIEERTTTTNTTTTTPTTLENCNKININENLCRKLNDNTNLVPNISTNVSNVHTIVTNNYKSSISLDNTNNISCYVPNIQQQYDVNLYGKKSSILYKYEGEQQKDEIQHQQQQQLQQKQQLPDKSITGNGKYICTYCNLACSKPSVLQKHIRAHTNERPYPCVSCGFSFKTRSNLYKHCRSRTHANRLLGNKARGELNDDLDNVNETTTTIITTPTTNTTTTITEIQHQQQPTATKLYKPRFHTIFYEKNINIKENIEEDKDNHINDINNETYLKKNQTTSLLPLTTSTTFEEKLDEPLNLTNKRKRCISDAVESKSLIKELLLQNLSSDMQCEHCKMLFQTVTELELHKIRSCKGMIKLGEKYTRSNSVNVASILIQNNKNNNQFDTIQLKSPGPFLGKTRLIDSDKNKSFSFDDGLSNITKYPSTPIITSTTTFKLNSNLNDDKKQKIKLFGGQVKIQENKNNLENKLNDYDKEYLNYGGCLDQTLNNRMNENRVIKSSLQSGGTVLTNKNNYDINTNNTIKVQHTNSPFSYDIDEKKKINNDDINKYTNIIDFSQNAAKLLTPNIKQPNLLIPGLPIPNYQQNNIKNITQPLKIEIDEKINESHTNIFNPMNLLVNGKIVRYVPGMPGPIIAETPPQSNEIKTQTSVITTPTPTTTTIITTKEISPRSPVIKLNEIKKSPLIIENKKFQRPNSLALKPTSTILKQHHGLTPTMFNQILISPDTPRISKKYVQQYLNGNYFSYLGLKSTTKSVYCTLNKTQPSYVPHYKKLSMYSEWRQQDRKNDKLYVAGYDSRQKSRRYTIAGQKRNDLTTHSSYKFTSVEIKDKQNNQQKLNQILGGYECNDDYTYIRGRGRGRYVCEQCGIRCKKPSMLKKHIRTHSNDRPYTCSHCNFSFKTKGNLTKHMKSKAHNKNSTTSSSSSSTQQSSTPSSESDTEDSGMDSSDESTRQQEHEAAYGLLSLSQKSTQNFTTKTTTISNETNRIMNIDEINYVTKTNYAKNKCLEQPNIKLNNIKDITQIIDDVVDDDEDDDEDVNDTKFLGNFHENRPLTYPYYMSNDIQDEPISVSSDNNDDNKSPENIQNFQVIQRYQTEDKKNERTGVIVTKNTLNQDLTLRKRKYSNENDSLIKLYKNDEEIEEDDEVIDLSFNTTQKSNGSINYQQNDDSNGFILINQLETNVIKKISSSLSSSPKNYKEFDNNLETLADIATKQVKLEKNAMAKSVASEYLKLTTKQEYQNENERYPITKDVNDLIVKSEGNKCCTICSKSFNKPSQLRLHMNVHYLERPYRCDSCSVSFRTKGHLQKHERSASHHNKLSSSPALSSSEPRPFKCTDCNIAFRIHGHLAKHLRSKMHIMKLECLAKIPFGLYAELERSNSLLTEINTSDGDQCLESLRLLAKKVFINEGRQLKNLDTTDLLETD